MKNIMPIELSVVVPTFNEENTIINVLDSLVAHVPKISEIIVVDDGSTDNTCQIVENFSSRSIKDCNIVLIKHELNQGKTAAVRTGIQASKGNIVIIQDADLEYSPEDLPNLIYPISMGQADVVYGSRFLVRKASRVLYFKHYLANQFITFLSNLVTDINLTDVETGYKAFRGDLIRKLNLTSSGFGFEIEITAKISKLKCRIYEVPISYYGRTYQEGKKIGWRDGISAIYYIFRYNLFP
jgi:glycosyltransferase involved in cell wall biosynthesis